MKPVPATAYAAAIEALRDLAGRCHDLDALIGDQGGGIYAGWKRAIDAADAITGSAVDVQRCGMNDDSWRLGPMSEAGVALVCESCDFETNLEHVAEAHEAMTGHQVVVDYVTLRRDDPDADATERR